MEREEKEKDMSKEVYITRTFTLTLRTTETPTGNSADRRLAQVLKYAGRVQGFRCTSSIETKGESSNAKETQK